MYARAVSSAVALASAPGGPLHRTAVIAPDEILVEQRGEGRGVLHGDGDGKRQARNAARGVGGHLLGDLPAQAAQLDALLARGVGDGGGEALKLLDLRQHVG